MKRVGLVICAALFVIPCLCAAQADESERAQPNEPQLTDPGLDAEDAAMNGVQLTREEIERLLSRYAHEPSAASVVAAALRAVQQNPKRFSDMAERARLRGLLPSLDLGARRGQGVDLRSATSDEPAVHLTTADDLMLFATLRFELSRLLFAAEEVMIARERRFAEHAKRELVRQVVHLYFLRRRLQLERDARGRSDLARELRISEAEALLDVFTDGAFGRMLGKRTSTWTTGARINVSKPR